MSLKNIERPVQAFSVQWEPSDWQLQRQLRRRPSHLRLRRRRRSPLPDKPSIAVLPFQNMSGDPEQEYFADGMVEDIITALSRFKSLFVIARNSSFAYKGKSPRHPRRSAASWACATCSRAACARAATASASRASSSTPRPAAHLWADRFDGAWRRVRAAGPGDAWLSRAPSSRRLRKPRSERASRKPTEQPAGLRLAAARHR